MALSQKQIEENIRRFNPNLRMPGEQPAQPQQVSRPSPQPVSPPLNQADQNKQKMEQSAQISYLVDQAFGATDKFNLEEWAAPFRSGARDFLGQPNVDGGQILSSTRNMGETFARRYLEKTGQLPPPEMVNEFVKTNLNPSLAAKMISGGTNASQIGQNYADPYIEEKGVLAPGQQDFGQQVQDSTEKQKGLLGQYIESLIAQETQKNKDQFGAQRGQTIDELAAQGLLTQPQSRQSLARVDEQANRSLSDIISRLRGQQAGLAQGIESEGLGRIQQESEFGRTHGLRRKTLSEQIRQFQENQDYLTNRDRQSNDLARQLGRMQAEANEPGLLDYLNTGAGAAQLAVSGYQASKGKIKKI